MLLSSEYPPLAPGGIGRQASDTAEGLAARRHEVHVVTPDRGAHRVIEERGVWVHRVKVPPPDDLDLGDHPLAGNLCHAAALEREALRINERQPLDLIAAPIWAFDGFFALADPAVPVVTMLMTTFETIAELEDLEDTPYGPAVLRLERDVLARSSYFHANSAAIAKEVAGRVTGDIRVAPLGVRDHTSTFHRRRVDERIRVLFVGRLEKRKGPDVLFEAMQPLLIEHPDLDLEFVGRDTLSTGFDGTYRERWERRLRMLPDLASRIRFAGHVDEAALQQAYADADIFCAPSRFESFGLVLLEAMQYGVPVVSTLVGGIPEVVGDAGLLVPPDDTDALRAALRSLVEDGDLRRRLGEQSRRRFRTTGTLDVAIDGIDREYRDIAAVANRRARSLGELRAAYQAAAERHLGSGHPGAPALAHWIMSGATADHPTTPADSVRWP